MEALAASAAMAQDTTATRAPDVSTRLYRAAIGTPAQERYLLVFKAFDRHGGARVNWHLAACLSAINWLVFRGLGRWAIALGVASLLLAIAVLGVAKLLFGASAPELTVLLLSLTAATSVAAGLTADAAFYRVCNKRILAAVAASSSIDEATDLLAAQARRRGRWPALALANTAIVLFGLGFVGLLLPNPAASVYRAAPPTRAGGLATSSGVIAQTVPVTPQPPASTPAPVAASPPALTGTVAVALPELASAADRTHSTAASFDSAAISAPHQGVQAAIASTPAATTAITQQAQAEKKIEASTATALSYKQLPAKPRESFAVQIGIFAQPDNSDNALAKARALGLPAYAETVKSGDAAQQRVRAGPFATQRRALNAVAKLQTVGLPAVVVKLQLAGVLTTP